VRALTGVDREFSAKVREEMDFRREAENMERFRESFGGDRSVRVPVVYGDLTRRRVLVMEYCRGTKIDGLQEQFRTGKLSFDRIMESLTTLYLRMMMVDGFLHADPHPGNLHVTPDGKLVMLDFGIFGELDERTRRRCALSVWALVRGDMELASMHLARMARVRPEGDVRAFRAAVEDKYRLWRESKVSDYGLGRLVFDAMSLAGRHGLELPSDAILVGKALTTIEGLVLWVDPNVDLNAEMQPYLNTMAQRLFDPRILGAEVMRSLPMWWDVLEQLPLGLAELMERQLSETEQPSPSGDDRLRWVGLGAGLSGLALLAFGAAQLQPEITMAVGLTLLLIAALVRRAQDREHRRLH
jgi:ubiquinone biosynthesis protein